MHVGYLNNLSGPPNPADTPTPFDPDATTTLLISSGGVSTRHDTGVIRFENRTSVTVSIDPGLRITTEQGVFQIWDKFLPIILAPGQNLVLAETENFNFDTSNSGLGSDPLVTGSVNSQAFSFTDSARVLLGHEDAVNTPETTPYEELGRITLVVALIDWIQQGAINGEPIAGTGSLEFRDTGDFQAIDSFSAFPLSFHPFATGGSLKSNSCCNGCKPIAGALNLISLTGGNYQGVRNFIIRDPEGKTVGNFTLTLSVQRDDDTHFKATQSIGGFYNGPTNLVSMTDYDLPLRQIGTGKVGDEYAATFTTADGDIFVINATSEYTYTGEQTLPFDEGMKIRYQSFSFEHNGNAAEFRLVGNSIVLPLVSEPDLR